jgi:succinate dehydrogenase/fumarate reductase flavoprotein subunit
MLRKEMGGVHNREDYPKSDGNWLKNIILQLENGQTTARTNPIIKIE